MSALNELNNLVADTLNSLMLQARKKETYNDAIKSLKSEQTRIARNGLPDRPNEIDRAILHLADTIYGEAIYQIGAEAREQPIKEV